MIRVIAVGFLSGIFAPLGKEIYLSKNHVLNTCQ